MTACVVERMLGGKAGSLSDFFVLLTKNDFENPNSISCENRVQFLEVSRSLGCPLMSSCVHDKTDATDFDGLPALS